MLMGDGQTKALAATWLPGPLIRDEAGQVIGRGPAEPCPELLTQAEAARFLRLDHLERPAEALYRYRRFDGLRACKISNETLYSREELQRWLKTRMEGSRGARGRRR